MQQLWTSGIDWDDPIPTDVGVLCSRYQSELHQIENISTPRHITHDNAISTQLHEFYDSSEKGYAAAIYLRVETATSIHCQLIIGKSNVAPLKRTTIPRLKLCSAHLAAKLLHLVRTTYTDRVQIDDLFAWTDFTTALVWIRSSPHRWDTFVANRTSQIQELTTPSIWRHVPTKLNPADCASKGLFPSELENHSLWWTGPLYLLDPPSKWPGATFHSPEDQTTKPLEKTKQDTQSAFSEDILRLKKSLRCSKNLRSLDIFLDTHGLIRFGGRLRNADVPYEQKHPLLLPSNHRVTDLLIDYFHQRLKHPGAAALQSWLQREWRIQSAQRVIRSRLRLCISCFHVRPRSLQPKMANLPKYLKSRLKSPISRK
ncbi:uncharacterized protein LOC112682853 [Sipha flava]|uniref:Uncharacterized protein LOC112682853 n=1 Tax=Sipha flava TaxID=143950 RepID=A0A8B8FFV6_9HEMI|nr:uncharacterized protein LOC112682853 [Sipha flava]